jgi:hypothetical protein
VKVCVKTRSVCPSRKFGTFLKSADASGWSLSRPSCAEAGSGKQANRAQAKWRSCCPPNVLR